MAYRKVSVVAKPVNGDQLVAELTAAGVPTGLYPVEIDAGLLVVTLALDSEDGSQDAAALAVLNAHVPWSAQAQADYEEARRGGVVNAVTAKRLAAPAVTTLATPTTVAGLSWSLKANAHFAFEIVGAYTAANANTGLALAVTGPASPALVRVAAQIAESATAVRNGVAAAYDTPVTGLNSGGATALPFRLQGNISTGAAGGTFALRFASEVGGSAVTIAAGSYGLLYCIG